VGQPELLEKMEDVRLRQLRQRVGVWHEILPLEPEDTREYIFHRLRLAGAPRPHDVIPTAVCDRVHALAAGVPRLVNQICDTALVIAYARNADRLEAEHVEEAATELRLVPQEVASSSAKAPEAAPAAPRSRPRAPRSPRRWPAAVGMILVFAILAGAVLGWTTLGWRPSAADEIPGQARPIPPESAADPALETTARSEVDPPVTAPEVASTTPDPTPEPEVAPPAPWREFQVAVADRAQVIERRRSASGTVYGVHLASFRSAEEARGFARGLVERNPAWAEPFYVDTVEGDPIWYRVLSGGFANSGEARRWVRTLRDGDLVSYAQLTRLPASAEALTAGTGESR